MKPTPPLLWPCICFCIGIAFARFTRIPFLVFLISSGLSFILSLAFSKSRTKFLFLLCAAFFLGSAIFRNSQVLPACHIDSFTPYKSEHAYLVGTIISDPIFQKKSISFVLSSKMLKDGKKWHKVCGRVLVKVFKRVKFSYGDRLLLEGRLYKAFYFPISERLNYRDYLRHQGIYSIFSVKTKSLVEILDVEQANPIVSFALRLRHRLKGIVENNLSPLPASILNAIILGERYKLPAYVRDILVNTGTVHIIAISGLHLGIVALIILTIFKFVRIPRKGSYIIAIPILIVYCFLTGSRIPVIRATIMATILLTGYIIGREADILNSLSLAALVILALNPWQLFDVSFQLSFMSIISIVVIAPVIQERVFKTRSRKPVLATLMGLFSVSLAAWLGLMPLIAYYFKIIAPITILANIIVVPYMTIVVASGFGFLLAGLFSPVLAASFSILSNASIAILIKITSFLSHFPFAYFYIPSFSIYIVVFYYLLLFFVLRFLKVD